jgi:uncharacterized phage protein (TIGR02220 family)
MAENKKSFVLYADLIKSIEHLTYEEKGILLTHLLEYVNDMNPILTDRLILTAWKPIELQLKRDLKKFEEVKEKRSLAGKRSAELRALKIDEQAEANSTSVESVEQTPTNPTDNVNDNVNDTVNVINNNTINFDKLLSFLNSLTKRNFKLINEATKKKYRARIKDGYTSKDIANAMKNAVNSDYHKENNFTYLTPEFFSRAVTLDKYSNTNNKTKEKNVKKSLIPKGVSFSGPQY